MLRVTVSVRPATHLLRRPGRRRLLDAEIHLLSWDHPLFDAQLGTSLERGVVGRLLVRLAPSGEGTYHLRPTTQGRGVRRPACWSQGHPPRVQLTCYRKETARGLKRNVTRILARATSGGTRHPDARRPSVRSPGQPLQTGEAAREVGDMWLCALALSRLSHETSPLPRARRRGRRPQRAGPGARTCVALAGVSAASLKSTRRPVCACFWLLCKPLYDHRSATIHLAE